MTNEVISGDRRIGTALQRHREKRRARASEIGEKTNEIPEENASERLRWRRGPGPSQGRRPSYGEPAAQQHRRSCDGEIAKKSSEAQRQRSSLGDSQGRNKSDKVNMVVRTTAEDRLRMRKISKLGLEDPVYPEKLQDDENDAAGRTDMEVVFNRTKALQQMQMVSSLGFEDPADRDDRKSRQPHSKPQPHAESTESTKINIRRRSRERRCLRATSSGGLPGLTIPSRESVRRCKSDSLRDSVPFVVASPDESINSNRLSDSIFVDTTASQRKKAEKYNQRRSVRTSLDIAVNSKSNASKQKRVSGGPRMLGGVIETTKQQQELMRKVSALGMQDPVYDDTDEDMQVHRTSIIFEEMDKNEFPESIRDTVTTSTDPTEEPALFVAENLRSPGSSETAAMTGFSSGAGSEEQQGVLPQDFVPPVGSFTRRVSKKVKPQQVLAQRQQPNENQWTPSESATNSNSHNFISPQGSFNQKISRKSQPMLREAIRKDMELVALAKSRKSKPISQDIIRKDMELAALAQTMFAEDNLMSMSASSLGQSLSSLNFDMDDENDGEVETPTSSTSSHRQIARPVTSRETKEKQLVSSYVPPAPLLDFTPEMSADESDQLGPNLLPFQTTAKPISTLRRNCPNSRSWDGDLDVVEPIPMASLAIGHQSHPELRVDFSS